MSQENENPPEPPSQPPQLNYRAAEDDYKPGEAFKVLAFMVGMVVGIFLCALGGGFCIGGVISGPAFQPMIPTIAVVAGLIFFGLSIWAAVSFVGLKRKHRTDSAFLLGLLCGVCIACLLEGLCFTTIGLSQ